MNEPLFLAIDAGGTRTRAALITREGTVLGTGSAGPGNDHDRPTDEVAREIKAAMRAAFVAARRPFAPVELACFAMASAASPTDLRRLTRMAKALRVAQHVLVVHDSEATLAGGLALRPGIGIICGTGCSVIGRDAQGGTWRTSGFGGRMDDGGAGAWMGLEALKAVARAADGRGPKTALTRPLLRKLGVTEARAMLPVIESPNFGRSDVADLASLVTRAARSGDRVAKSILARGAEEIALDVAVVVKRLNFARGPIECVMTGGLADGDAAYAKRIRAAVKARVPRIVWREAQLPPIGGAALIALREYGSVTPVA